MGTREARAIGFVDDCFGDTVAAFEDVLAQRAKDLAQRADFWRLLREKHERRLTDERGRPLAAYRAEELERMAANFFGPDPAYHLARRRFVYKNRTPNYPEERPGTRGRHRPPRPRSDRSGNMNSFPVRLAALPAVLSKANSGLVRRLVAAESDPAKQRIRAWLTNLDDQQLSGIGQTREDIAILRGARMQHRSR